MELVSIKRSDNDWLKISKTRITKRLNALINRKALKISGDLALLFLNVLLFLNKGRNDWINPFIQNEQNSAVIKRKISYSPIACVLRLLLANRMLINNSVPNRIS